MAGVASGMQLAPDPNNILKLASAQLIADNYRSQTPDGVTSQRHHDTAWVACLKFVFSFNMQPVANVVASF
jgi:hypothetical protein